MSSHFNDIDRGQPYAVQKYYSTYESHNRKFYRTFRDILKNPFRYVKVDSIKVGGYEKYGVNTLANTIIKNDLDNLTIIFPSRPLRRPEKRSFVIITKDSIKIIRKNFDAFYFFSSEITPVEQKRYINETLEGTW